MKTIPVIVLYTPACLPASTQECTHMYTYRSHQHTPVPVQTCTHMHTCRPYTHAHTQMCIHTHILQVHTCTCANMHIHAHLQISQAHICTRANMHTQYTYRPHRHTHAKLSITTFSGLEPWLSDPKAFPVLFKGPDFSSQHSGGEGCNCLGLQLRGFW